MATNDKTAPAAEAAVSPAVPAAETAAAPAKVDRKGKQLSATVTPEFYAAFNDLQWDLRKSPTDLLRQAAEEFLAKHKPEAPAAK